VAALAATTLSGCATSATRTSSPTTIVDASVRVAHTSEGDVGYRTMGSGPALVLIMGYAGSMETWDPHFVDALSRHFRVIIFDNAGIGSTAAIRAPLSIDAMADQTGALITALHLSSASASVIAAQKSAVLAWFDGRDPAGREATRISAPTLVADGANDRIDAAANDRAVAAEIPGSRLVLYPDAGHAFLFQEGTPFTFLVRTFLAGAPAAIAPSQVRQRYLADQKASNAAGRRWASGLKSLTASSTAQDLARIDLRFADALGALDDELLGYGANGTLGTSISALVNADELVGRDVLALAVQGGSKAKAWTTTIGNDGKVLLALENALRRHFGLAPITTTTTTTTPMF
jgi:hypothetical protein